MIRKTIINKNGMYFLPEIKDLRESMYHFQKFLFLDIYFWCKREDKQECTNVLRRLWINVKEDFHIVFNRFNFFANKQSF